MEVTAAIIGATAVISAAIIAGIYSRNKAQGTLQKFEILDRLIATTEKKSTNTGDESQNPNQPMIDRLEKSINMDIYELSGSEKRGVVAYVIGLILLLIGAVALIQSALANNEPAIKTVLIFLSFIFIMFGCVALFLNMIPDVIEMQVKKHYARFIKQNDGDSDSASNQEELDKIEKKIKKAVARSSNTIYSAASDDVAEKAIQLLKNGPSKEE